MKPDPSELCQCGHSAASHALLSTGECLVGCPCPKFEGSGKFRGADRVLSNIAERPVLEVAFIIQDPCGESDIELARQVLQLITNRDDVTVAALLPELRYLNMKYPKANGAPLHRVSNTHQRKR